MKKIFTLFTILFLFCLSAFSQDTISNKTITKKTIKPLTHEERLEYIYKDRLDSTFVAWTVKQKSDEVEICFKTFKDKVENYQDFCSCIIEEVSQVINYDRYSAFSEYQKGSSAGELAKGKCKLEKK